MERITTSETLWDVLGKAYDAVYRLQEIENILGDNYDLERLKELVEADREERCVALPCKVGSMVYVPLCNDVVKKRIGQFYVNGYTNPRIWADIDCDWSTTQSVRWDLAFGKTVFFTEKEAEAALKRMKKREESR